jgi:hypothetical protein
VSDQLQEPLFEKCKEAFLYFFREETVSPNFPFRLKIPSIVSMFKAMAKGSRGE